MANVIIDSITSTTNQVISATTAGIINVNNTNYQLEIDQGATLLVDIPSNNEISISFSGDGFTYRSDRKQINDELFLAEGTYNFYFFRFSSGIHINIYRELYFDEETITETGTTRTIQLSDRGKMIVFTNVSGCLITCPDNLPPNLHCNIVRDTDAGVVTVTASTSLKSSGTQITVPDEGATIKHTGNNVWRAFGLA